MKVLIDTNCYSALMRGDEEVSQFLDDAKVGMETGAILLSRDQHFNAIEGLLVWQP
jgi:predicted nucleic acid-binding protein